MVTARYAVLLLVAGCRQIAGLDDPLPGGDACVGSGDWEICLAAAPSAQVSLPSTIVTSGIGQSALCLPSTDWSWTRSSTQPDACVIAAEELDVTAPVRATGELPLVLVAADTIMILASIDVASHSDTGAGAGILPCSAFVSTPGEDSQGGGGGAGGSFTSQGGDGGEGNGNALPGTAGPTLTALILRGGCSGQDGARGNGGGSVGVGGAGGGAVYIAAGTSITVTGSINASGAGGGGGRQNGGAGGGGSGGMIALHAPTITGSGVLIANGGGGGAGASDSVDGGAGGISTTAAATTPAAGGSGAAGSGVGGTGFGGAAQAASGTAAPSNIGGAGGGGGAGAIRVNVGIAGVTSSPAVTIVP